MVERIIAKEPNEMGLSRKRTSSVMNELSSRLTEVSRYRACEDDIMLCGLRLA